MANRHQLFLEIPNVKNTGVLLVKDESIYSPVIAIGCPYLEITPPGFVDATVLSVDAGFSLALNACSLGIMGNLACSENCPVIPDGIYNFRYSVSPNDKVYVEYYFLRITQLSDAWNRVLADVGLEACEPSQDKVARIKELYLIKALIDAAKTEVEDRHDTDRGMYLLNYGKKRLEKLISGCKNC